MGGYSDCTFCDQLCLFLGSFGVSLCEKYFSCYVFGFRDMVGSPFISAVYILCCLQASRRGMEIVFSFVDVFDFCGFDYTIPKAACKFLYFRNNEYYDIKKVK